MALKTYKPTTPGRRGLVLVDRSELWKGKPVKSLTEGLSKSGGVITKGRAAEVLGIRLMEMREIANRYALAREKEVSGGCK